MSASCALVCFLMLLHWSSCISCSSLQLSPCLTSLDGFMIGSQWWTHTEVSFQETRGDVLWHGQRRRRDHPMLREWSSGHNGVRVSPILHTGVIIKQLRPDASACTALTASLSGKEGSHSLAFSWQPHWHARKCWRHAHSFTFVCTAALWRFERSDHCHSLVNALFFELNSTATYFADTGFTRSLSGWFYWTQSLHCFWEPKGGGPYRPVGAPEGFDLTCGDHEGEVSRNLQRLPDHNDIVLHPTRSISVQNPFGRIRRLWDERAQQAQALQFQRGECEMAFLHCEQAVRDDLTMALLCANQVPDSNLNARIRTLEKQCWSKID